jgi:hypothetical protein
VSGPPRKATSLVAALRQRPRRHPPAFDVVDADHMDMGRAGVDARKLCTTGTRRCGTPCAKSKGSVEDATTTAVDRVLAQQRQRVLRVGLIGEIDQQRAQPALLQAAGEQVEHFEKDRVVEVVGDQADQLGAPGGQAARPARWGCSQALRPPSRPLRRVLIDTDAPSVKVRETAERDTPARSATSFKVTDMPCLRP